MAELKRDKDWKVIQIKEEHHVDIARRAAREYAWLMGFGEIETAFITTSVSELAMNIFVHTAGSGTSTIRTVSMGEKKGLEIVFADQGPGIEDIERVLKGGYSTKGTLGIGLSGTKRMMDELEIESGLGRGTRIWIRKWL